MARKRAIKPIKPILCSECDSLFYRTNTRQKVCLTCKVIVDAQRRSGWFKHKYATDESFRKRRQELVRKHRAIWLSKNVDKEKIRKRISENSRRAVGKIDRQIFQSVYEDNIKKYGSLTCILCLEKIEFGNDSLEHKIPISRGGTNSYDNLAVSHLLCNIRKNAKTVEEYQRYIGVIE